jgi:hypothetical protein
MSTINDLYKKFYKDGGVTAPARGAVAVTPSDSTVLTDVRSIYVGISGDVSVYMVGSTTSVTFLAVPVGILPIQVDRILATGTDATNMVALS